MATATFWSLIVAAACLWLPRDLAPRLGGRLWVIPALLGAMLGLAGGLLDGRGLVELALLAAAAHFANHATHRAVRLAAHLAVVVIATGMFLHVLPGFFNPRVIDHVILGPGAVPYTQYLNIDKGVAGVLLLGLYVPERVESDEGFRHLAGFVWRFAVVIAVVMTVALATGYLTWDPKLPSWWPTWLWIMVVLTALPEEAAFRGVIHEWLARRTGDVNSLLPIVAGGLAFGLAHFAGGPLYVVVASLAGVGYGWIYASTRSIGAAILAHAGLNTIHLLLFTYPALR